MFVPSQYRAPDEMWMVDLIRANPLAVLVVNGDRGEAPYVTHLPVIPDPEMTEEWSADLSGGRLLGHMNRANPHWSALRSGDPVVAVFTGPHAYVSPTVYDVSPAAPTWNFTSVHAHCVIEKFDSVEDTLGVVTETVSAFEGRFGTGWDMTESVGYFKRIVPAVGGFRLRITRADGMFKLSQEQPADVRDRVTESFGCRHSTRHRDTAALMSRLP